MAKAPRGDTMDVSAWCRIVHVYSRFCMVGVVLSCILKLDTPPEPVVIGSFEPFDSCTVEWLITKAGVVEAVWVFVQSPLR